MEGVCGDVTGIVLIGGKSRRMGEDKALLQIGGRALAEIAVAALAEVVLRVMLVGGPAERVAHLGLPTVPDVYPGSALGGLYTGLLKAGSPWIFATACDMPFPSSALIGHLLSLRHGQDVVVPQRGGFPEPLFAAYSRRCLPHMKELLTSGRFRIDALFSRVRTRFVKEEELSLLDPRGTSFANVNTPEEYRRILASHKVRP